MLGVIVTGLIAGAASALLFATVVSGSPLTIVLFYAAPLPLMIAGLGWSHRAALIGAVAGAVGIAAAITPEAGLVHAAGVGLPAFILSYLALLGRREDDVVVEWFPAGSLVAVAALLGGAVGIAGAVTLGPSYEEFSQAMQSGVTMMLKAQMGIPDSQPLVLPDVTDPAAFVSVLAALIPPIITMFFVFTALLNLWLAGRVAERSGRLPRPWPPFSTLTLPFWAGPAFVISGLASAFPGMTGLVSELFAAGFLMAFSILGFAVLHAMTMGVSARPIILAGVYIAAFAMGWPLFVVAGLGLFEQLFRLRARLAARRGPTTPEP